jgi:hypothetical protein
MIIRMETDAKTEAHTDPFQPVASPRHLAVVLAVIVVLVLRGWFQAPAAQGIGQRNFCFRTDVLRSPFGFYSQSRPAFAKRPFTAATCRSSSLR